MIKNYLKIAFRNLIKNKGLTFIHIFGLAVSIACCLVISLYLKDEFSYDKHNKDANRIHRVVKDFMNDDGSTLPDATTPPAMAIAIQCEVPEVEHVVRLFPGWGRKFYVRYGENKFIEENVYRADSSIFDVFTIPFLQGSAKTAFGQLKSVVLTETAARKYFGKEDPMGKVMEFDQMGPHTVSAVVKDLPSTSHFHFDFLISTRTIGGEIDNNWGFYNFYTYIKLKENTDIASVEPKIIQLFKKHQPENKNVYYTQPLTSIHLHSNLKWELETNSDISYVYIVITIGLFIIIIACINYVNLSTARSSLRAKEIGVRKVAGAERPALIRQFLIESILITLIATVVAAALAQLIMPYINNIIHKELGIFAGKPLVTLGLLFLGAILIGLIAGLYPAIYLSSFRPVQVMKGLGTGVSSRFNLRKVLVILQFSISIVLIIGAIVVSKQVDFIQSAKLGLDKDQVLYVPEVGTLERSERAALKSTIAEIPGVKRIAFADGIVGGQNWTNSVRYKGSENSLLLNFLNVDYDYLDVLSIPLKEGRNFSPKFLGDTADGIILNETAVKQLGIPSPVIGQQVVWSEDEDTTYYAKVVGVIKDFHFTSMRSEIKPFGFVTDNNRQGYFAIKLDTKNVRGTIDNIQAAWNKFASRPFQYFFLDETYDKLYEAERNFRTVFFYITILAILIACLGLFGLVSFMTIQRTKEIGIRKVLGASVAGIVTLLSKDFLKLVMIAMVVAFPVAWFAVSGWLQDFAYRINISVWVFAIAAILAVMIALLTISIQAVRAAIANPVKSLRTE